MASSAGAATTARLTGLASSFGAFLAEHHPFALADALEALDAAIGGREPRTESEIDGLRPAFKRQADDSK